MDNISLNKDSDSNSVRSDLAKIRRAFRVPVQVQDDMAVMIADKNYRVVNISPEGVNIANTDHAPFTIGESIENCHLIISGSRMENLTARVVHCSCGADGRWNNGIKWIDLTDKELSKIAGIVSKIKQRLRQELQE